MKKITFHSHRTYNNSDQENRPAPASSVMPEWYVKADRYDIDDETGERVIYPDGAKHPTFKACPALFDFFAAGYVLKTPCNIKFIEQDGHPGVATEAGFQDFCIPRTSMKQFPTPEGHHEDHFHWSPSWAPGLPDGYSAIYTHPINRFDLPFMTVAGIIDNDKMNTPGLTPFFIKKGFTGVITAGTPYLQIIPFKREDWEMDIKLYSSEEIQQRHNDSYNTFRTPDGGVYKKTIWSRKKYK